MSKTKKYLFRYELLAYKEVTASSPEEAQEIAEENPPSLSDYECNEAPEIISEEDC